jgi:hypothetical protein
MFEQITKGKKTPSKENMPDTAQTPMKIFKEFENPHTEKECA